MRHRSRRQFRRTSSHNAANPRQQPRRALGKRLGFGKKSEQGQTGHRRNPFSLRLSVPGFISGLRAPPRSASEPFRVQVQTGFLLSQAKKVSPGGKSSKKAKAALYSAPSSFKRIFKQRHFRELSEPWSLSMTCALVRRSRS